VAAVPYSVHTLDLSVATPGVVELVPPGRGISSVAVLQLPVGASFYLAFGPSAPLIPFSAQGIQFKPHPQLIGGRCEYPGTGLYAAVTSVFAGSATLLVTYGAEGLMEVSGGGALPTQSQPAGFWAAQAFSSLNPAAPFHHFALARNESASRLVVVRSVKLALPSGVLYKVQVANALEPSAIASPSVLVQKTDPRLTDASVMAFYIDNSTTNGAGPARFAKAVNGAGTWELLTKPLILQPGQVLQIDETDSTTQPGAAVSYEWDQL
jgi:hypothetical protein